MIKLEKILQLYRLAIISMSKCEYDVVITYYELILNYLDENKDLIEDEAKLRENINNNIEACKLLLKSL